MQPQPSAQNNCTEGFLSFSALEQHNTVQLFKPLSIYFMDHYAARDYLLYRRNVSIRVSEHVIAAPFIIEKAIFRTSK